VRIAGQDRTAISGGGERWGTDLYAAQIDSMSRKTAIRPLPWAAQVPIAIALALAGAFAAVGLRGRTHLVRVVAVTAIGALFVVAAVLLYRSEQLLVGIPYGLVALALGAWLGGRFSSGGLR